ncbi:MAG: hypothetical protein GF313_16430, partial [Caldithrix sp.]|nr:hypothetical protein [Caldithrix sp.]
MKYSIHLILFLTIPLFAQDFTGIKIYINPGHGGYDSDDRYIPQTGFWESEGNLTKGLYLRDLLESLGAEVYMSRTKNRTQDDLPLSQISADANANDVHYFHSIHSNAFDGSVNYPLMLFRGYDDAPVFPAAKEMGSIMWNEMNEADGQWTYWAYGYENNRGDWDFYPWGTSGLGVLRDLNMPGTLSEGSFHDYIPNSWRLQSIDYRKHESIVMLRSFISFYDLEALDWGVVAGILRTKNESVNYSYDYISGLPHDNKKTINGGSVILQSSDEMYTVDANNNGFFMFDSLQPGTYTVIFDDYDYIKDSVTVSVQANKTSFANGFLEYDTQVPPSVIKYSPDKDSIDIRTSFSLTFDRSMDQTSTEEAFQIAPQAEGSFVWLNNNRILKFYPSKHLIADTVYHISMSQQAKSTYDIPLKNAFAFEIKTRKRNHINVVRSFPQQGLTDVSTQLQFYLEFNGILDDNTILGNFTVQDKDGNFIAYRALQFNEYEEVQRSALIFEPRVELERNRQYIITLFPEIKDINNLPLLDTTRIAFQTQKSRYDGGNVAYDFESGEDWIDPDSGAFTKNIDTENTTFNLSATKKISGNYAGKLEYAFSGDSAGVCHLSKTDLIMLSADTTSTFGLWLFGDYSENELQLLFTHQGGDSNTIDLGTIDWAGWKLISLPVSTISNQPTFYFSGMLIKQNPQSRTEGSVYLDDMQTDIVTGIEQRLFAQSKS